jgi:hypothetical protein
MKPYKIYCDIQKRECIGFITDEKPPHAEGVDIISILKPYTSCPLKRKQEFCNLSSHDKELELTEEEKLTLLKFLLTGKKEYTRRLNVLS